MLTGPHETDVLFPHTLEPGKGCIVRVPADVTARTLTDKKGRDFIKLVRNTDDIEDTVYSGKIKIKGEYSDMAERSYRSGWVNVDLDKWLEVIEKTS